MSIILEMLIFDTRFLPNLWYNYIGYNQQKHMLLFTGYTRGLMAPGRKDGSCF